MIEIWQPRWHDRKALIATYKVKSGINKIRFTKAKCFKDMIFKLEGEVIRGFPVETNGTINCYAVPLDLLTSVGEEVRL